MRMTPKQLISSGSVSGTTTSVGLDVGQVYNFSIHSIATGGTGAVVVQGSNDLVQDGNGTTANPAVNVVNWTPLSGGTHSWIAGSSSIISFTGIAVKWVRVQQVQTTGTSAVTVNFFGMGV